MNTYAHLSESVNISRNLMSAFTRWKARASSWCDAFVSPEFSYLHPVHPVHPVEKSGFDLTLRIVVALISE
jgi:hypothetical protein